MDPSITLLAVLSVGVGARLAAHARRRKRLRDYFSKPAGFTVRSVMLQGDVVGWEADGFSLRLRWLSKQAGGRYGQRCMHVDAVPDPLAGRTSLRIRAREATDALVELAGFHAVRTGHDDFDSALRAVADRPDALRALLDLPAVRRAVVAMFASPLQLSLVELDSAGLHCRRPSRTNETPEEAHRFLQQVHALCVALRDHADVPPLVEPLPPPEPRAQGTLGGSPLAIPVSLEKPEKS